MNGDEIQALITIIIVVIGVPLFVGREYIFSNSLRSKRAREMKGLADELGLKFELEKKRTLWERMSSYQKTNNIITGNIDGEPVNIYDYLTVNKVDGSSRLGTESRGEYTLINGRYCKPILSVETLRQILKKEVPIDSYLIGNVTTKYGGSAMEHKFNKGMFVIITFLTFCTSFILFNLDISNPLKLVSIILVLIAGITLATWLAKKTPYIVWIK